MTRSLVQRDDMSQSLGGNGTAAFRDSSGSAAGSGKLNQAAASETFPLRVLKFGIIDFFLLSRHRQERNTTPVSPGSECSKMLTDLYASCCRVWLCCIDERCCGIKVLRWFFIRIQMELYDKRELETHLDINGLDLLGHMTSLLQVKMSHYVYIQGVK